MEIVDIITLSLSSLLLIFVSLMRISNPIKNYLKNSGIQLENDADLLNELRGVSFVMLCGGIISLLGIFISSISPSSFLIGSLIFIGFAIGRIVSIAIDGMPNKQIIQGIVFEIVFGLANLFCLVNNAI